MSKKVKGTVTKASKGKYSWFLQLDGDDFYYNTKYEPKCGEGDVVGIEFTPKGDARGNIQKVKVLEDNSGGYAKANSERAESSGGGSSGSGGDRNSSIVFQSSRKDALVYVGLLLQEEAFAIKGKPDLRRVQLDELLDEVTARFYQDAIDPSKVKWLAAVAEEGEEESSNGDDDWPDDEEWPD